MSSPVKPFVFKTQHTMVLLTGRKAFDVAELSAHLKEIPDSSLYFHTHAYLLKNQHLLPQPPNDFAYWVADVLSESRLGEGLMAIDTVRYTSFAELRAVILATIDGFLSKNPPLRRAAPGEEFYFMQSVPFSLLTGYEATDLPSLLECLKRCSIHSLYYHLFEGRLRTGKGRTDFSLWLETLGEKGLARQIEKLDPYTQTMESLRSRMVYLIEGKLEGLRHAAI